MTRLGIVTGLVREAAIVRRATATAGADAPLVHCDGPGPDRAARAARAALAEGAGALLSFGVAGGLDPNFQRGTVVVAEHVIAPGEPTFDCDAEWRNRVLANPPAQIFMVSGALAGSPRPLRSAKEKAAMFEATKCAAVDMESFVVARIAHDADVPFLCIRAIADPASRELPESWLRTVSADGRIIPFAVLIAFFASLVQVAELAKMAMDGRAAFASLGRVASLGPRFGLV